jgi:hypothetical protein
MKLTSFVITTALAITLALVAAASANAAPDFGDHRSETLTTKAWDAYGSRNFDDALAYSGKTVELYEVEAKAMQAALKELPRRESKEDTAKRWALNDVGTSLFIKGEILLKQGNKKAAKEAFDMLVKEFPFAQCWDPKGWFWKPADAAKKRLAELEFDAK